MAAPPLPRTAKVGDRGKDIEGHKRAVARLLGYGRLRTLMSQLPAVRRYFGVFFRDNVKLAQGKLGIDRTGVIGPATYDALVKAGAYDAAAYQLLREYSAAMAPKLVEPNQGFSSLHSSLWKAYSLGRSMGLSDLGTYNPASTLPGGGPSDHSVYPAYAFDLGIEPDTGWDNEVARRFALAATNDPAVEYVILGDRIWTNDGRGWHTYYSGGHLNHVHVSGIR